ncbi:hypothetical protein L3476_06735 [Paenibacillus thiaminolyticus]|uniref:hypothetical protein n=1 Tax=Paenibacillus thiaminolyticus TaxID=49283 RepID=UPI00235082EF|nr:hypothetical protein [Paenibacillus thiaminolyticus]WCR28431.1 hypothetical protein L3476_06735 [Paenibacillus thiaminolyticus]
MKPFLGGFACPIILTLLVMLGLTTMPKAMTLFSKKQRTSLKVFFLSTFVGTELHVLMDKIAINGWITF